LSPFSGKTRTDKSQIVSAEKRFAGANFTAGGRELFANRSREAGDSVLVKTEGGEAVRGKGEGKEEMGSYLYIYQEAGS